MTADDVSTTNAWTDTGRNFGPVSVTGSRDNCQVLWKSQPFTHELIKESSHAKPALKVIERVPQCSQQPKIEILSSEGGCMLGDTGNQNSCCQKAVSLDLLSSGDGLNSSSSSTSTASNAQAYRKSHLSRTSDSFSSSISLASTSSLLSSSERLRSRLEASVTGLKELATLRQKHELLVNQTMTAARQYRDRSATVSMGERIERRRSQSKINKALPRTEQSCDENKENQETATDVQKITDRCSNQNFLMEPRTSLDSRITRIRQSLNADDNSLREHTLKAHATIKHGTPESDEPKVPSVISEITVPPDLPAKLYRSQSLTGVSVLQAASPLAMKQTPVKPEYKSATCRKQSIFEGIDLRNTGSGPLRAVLLQYSTPQIGSEIDTDSSSTETICNDNESGLGKYSSMPPTSRKHRTYSLSSTCNNDGLPIARVHSQDMLHKRHSLSGQTSLNRHMNRSQKDNDSQKQSECKTSSELSNKLFCSNSRVSLALDSGENRQQGMAMVQNGNGTDLQVLVKTTRPPIPQRRPRLSSQLLQSEMSDISKTPSHPSSTSTVGHTSDDDQESGFFSDISRLNINSNSGSHPDVDSRNTCTQIDEQDYSIDSCNNNPQIRPPPTKPRLYRMASCHSVNRSVSIDLQSGYTCTSRHRSGSVFSSCINLNSHLGSTGHMIGDGTRHSAFQNVRVSDNAWPSAQKKGRSSVGDIFKHNVYQNSRTSSDDNSRVNVHFKDLSTANDNTRYVTNNSSHSGTDENNNNTFQALSKTSKVAHHRSIIGTGQPHVKQQDSRYRMKLSVWDVEETAI